MTNKAFFLEPHPDDFVLSMGLAVLNFIASGYEVHLVSVSRGEITAASIRIDGSNPCLFHGWTHDPGREGIPAPTPAELGVARLAESRSAFGAMSRIPMSLDASGDPYPRGAVVHHDPALPSNYGKPAGTTALPGMTCSREGVDLVKPLILDLATEFPGSQFHTMSPTDDHPDHAACGQALRELKADGLVSGRHFVSRLYWDYVKNPDVKAQPDKQWYGTGSSAFLARKAEYDAFLRTQVIQMFSCWNPAGGSYAIGYHQVAGQFNSNFGPTASIGNLWHA